MSLVSLRERGPLLACSRHRTTALPARLVVYPLLVNAKTSLDFAGSMVTGAPPGVAERLTENVELASECLTVLQQLIPQLSAEERVLVAMQHPFATSSWLDGLVALSQGQLSEDLVLISSLERELANAQVLVTARTHELRNRAAADAAPTGSAGGETPAASGRRAIPPPAPGGRQMTGSGRGTPAGGPSPARSRRTPPGSTRLVAEEAEKDEAAATVEHTVLDAEAEAEPEAEEAEAAELDEAGGIDADKEEDGAAAYEALGAGEDEGDYDDDDIDEERRARRQDGERFNSISEEIKALNAGLVKEPSTVKEVDDRVTCGVCGRKFAPERLAKHVEICKESKRNKEYRSNLAKANIRL